jgi:hypothetical protein
MVRKFLILFCLILFVSCNRTNNLGVYTQKINCEDCLVTKEETAVKIALPILYETYGEDKIKSEKPYIVEIEDDSIWNIKGSFLKIGFGGVFNIKISSKDGRVIEIIHGK